MNWSDLQYETGAITFEKEMHTQCAASNMRYSDSTLYLVTLTQVGRGLQWHRLKWGGGCSDTDSSVEEAAALTCPCPVSSDATNAGCRPGTVGKKNGAALGTRAGSLGLFRSCNNKHTEELYKSAWSLGQFVYSIISWSTIQCNTIWYDAMWHTTIP